MLILFLQTFDTPEEKNRFTDLYMKYRDLMFFVALKYMKDENLAEDIVHDAFIKIAENFDKLDDIENPKTKSYILVVVRNLSFNLLKRRKRETTLSEGNDDLIEIMTGRKAMSAQDEYIEQFGKEQIMKAIGKLPSLQRDVMYLNAVMEMDIKEIAKNLEIRKQTAYKRLQRAKAGMIYYLEQMKQTQI